MVRAADGGYTVNVLTHGLGGNTKRLWSLKASEPIALRVTGQPTSLTLASVGTRPVVNGAVVGFEPETGFAASIDRLAEGEHGPSGDFWCVIRLANGAVGEASARLSGDGPALSGAVTASDGDNAVLTYALVGDPVTGLTVNGDGTWR